MYRVYWYVCTVGMVHWCVGVYGQVVRRYVNKLMIIPGTILNVMDNSGVKKARVIRVLKVQPNKSGQPGDRLIASVVKVKGLGRFKRGDLVYMYFVGGKFSTVRNTGWFHARQDANVGVVTDAEGTQLRSSRAVIAASKSLKNAPLGRQVRDAASVKY